ncbi:peptidase T [Pontibacter sp. G13]|uniref:peptidase T n=1 Tax=Pontibacter sp. G13 TaxID=3074898 RepID=UPI00288A2590|nr:peptidase T [Pontibacter sp. G13]WNJ18109.1 peptidase T [Pontibacter sp. G13]
MTTYQHTAKERFLKYVTIDTESDPTSSTIPSTEKQKDLGRLLVEELTQMGIKDAELDEWGYVYATIPGNVPGKIPVICYCAHMDTSPDCTGKNVKPIVHANYQGQDLVLPDDNSIVLKQANHPDLAAQHGNDIITASGTTLLGADNKAGVAAIMSAAKILMDNPEIKHGDIRILFTPDEEIGRGADKVDIQKLGADFGYTIDGETLGSMEDETFSADGAKLIVHGVSVHPGFAKGTMESALKIVSDILATLPKDRLSPETTEGQEGFIHPVTMEGNADQAQVNFILRDFRTEKLALHAAFLEDTIKSVMANYPGSKYELIVSEQYRNMKEVLDQHPEVVDHAVQAIQRAGLEVKKRSIRGGTDGSRLSFMGLPCPNIFAGEHAFHGKEEWVSVQDMEKSAEVMVHLAQIWAE